MENFTKQLHEQIDVRHNFKKAEIQNKCSDANTFVCGVCEDSFKSTVLLEKHMQSCQKQLLSLMQNENNSTDDIHLCADCGKQYVTATALKVHRNKAHLQIKPYKCDVCMATFFGSSGLSQHRKTHTVENKFQCKECGKLFKQKQSLTTHTRIHYNIKEFSCFICGKYFTQKSAMIRHQRIHSGDRPFKCLLCPLRFADVSVLRRHCLGIHHLKKFKYDAKLQYCDETSDNSTFNVIDESSCKKGNDLNHVVLDDSMGVKTYILIPSSTNSATSLLNQNSIATSSCQSFLPRSSIEDTFNFSSQTSCLENFVSDMFDMTVTSNFMERNDISNVMVEEVVNSGDVDKTVRIKNDSSLSLDNVHDSSHFSDDLAVCYSDHLPIALDIGDSLTVSDDAVSFCDYSDAEIVSH